MNMINEEVHIIQTQISLIEKSLKYVEDDNTKRRLTEHIKNLKKDLQVRLNKLES